MFHPPFFDHFTILFAILFAICLRPRIGHFMEIGSNQAFTEGAHMVFPNEMAKYHSGACDVAAGFVEGWCGFVSWLEM